MQTISLEAIEAFVAEHIPAFHQNRINKLKQLRLKTVLRRKNPYLFRVKNITIAGDFVKTILDAYLSSQEETLFGGFMEALAQFVCHMVYGGQKSSAEGVDMEVEKDNIRYIISIKSGPNWGNSSQIKKMKDNFIKAMRILKTNTLVQQQIIAVNGCCYGREAQPDKGVYLKLCGQSFWTFISGDDKLYTDIIKPLGHKAKEKNEQFAAEYVKVANTFTLEFLQEFCGQDGAILWQKLIAFNSGNRDS